MHDNLTADLYPLIFHDNAASGSLPPSTIADLQELKALLLEAKADNEKLKAERDQVWVRHGHGSLSIHFLHTQQFMPHCVHCKHASRMHSLACFR